MLQCLNTFAVIFTSVDVVPNLVVGGVSSPSFLCVWDKVACVWDKVACVWDKVACVWDKVACVWDKVACVWDKVACVVCPLGLLSIYIVRCIGTPLM